MTKRGLKGKLTGNQKQIHDEIFKIDYEKVLQQHIECKYIEYYSKTGKHPNFEEYIGAFSNEGKYPDIEKRFTAVVEKYKGLTFNEVLELYKETYL